MPKLGETKTKQNDELTSHCEPVLRFRPVVLGLVVLVN